MVAPKRYYDAWTGPALLGWQLVFLVGLFPDRVFHLLRELGGVTTQSALTNTPGVVTVSLTAYLAYFVYGAAREAGASTDVAWANAALTTLFGLFAFLWLPGGGTTTEAVGVLGLLSHAPYILNPALRQVIYVAGGLKLAAWLFLFAQILRYYAFGNRGAFAHLAFVFPTPDGARLPEPEPEDTLEDREDLPFE